MNRIPLKRLTLLALFTTLALAIYYVESLLPTLVPIPGIKLGLANIITLLVLKNFSAKEAFLVLLAGGILCLLAMWLINRLLSGSFLFLTSIFGALFHNLGQLLVAILFTKSLAVLSSVPFFILSAAITGLFTGLCAHFTQKHLGKFLRSQLL